MCSADLHSGCPEIRGLVLSSVQYLLMLRHVSSFSLENVFKSVKKIICSYSIERKEK